MEDRLIQIVTAKRMAEVTPKILDYACTIHTQGWKIDNTRYRFADFKRSGINNVSPNILAACNYNGERSKTKYRLPE
ncbi:MAG: hypothetical protein WB870_14420 [Gallionellaceae bacterium]